MAKSFITNTETSLAEEMNNILPSAENLYFLVWYFYFSWFQELYKNLKNKHLKVLVWMDVELSISNTVKEVFNVEWYNPDQKTQSHFIESLRELVNKSNLFDNKINKEALDLFINKIINWSLEIRKTLEPNHSKLYLFENWKEFNQWGSYPWTVITGSSNLTYSWLTWRYEFNAIFRDKEDYISAKQIFNELRDNALPITSWWEDDQVVKMLKEETWLKVPNPYYCYLRLLFEYFENTKEIKTPSDITWWMFTDLQYQIDAIKDWLAMIEKHNWVIIADVVWLWKSIIWSTIINNLQEKAIIICPPHLKDQWEEYKNLFNIRATIFSSGKIRDARDFDVKYANKYWIVLIDEAHKYVNDDTIDYWYLHQICQWKKVILLTATPFNNKPADIFNLIKFFQIPEKSTIRTTNNLQYEFDFLQREYTKFSEAWKKEEITSEEAKERLKEIAYKIRNLISPVVVRRSRLDLQSIKAYAKDLERQKYDFSKVNDPVTKNYDLWSLESKYIETLNKLVEVDEKWDWLNFKWARYKVITYVKDPSKYEKKAEDLLWYNFSLLEWRQKNMPLFIRRLLVSRFESSLFAFKKSLKSIRAGIDIMSSYLSNVWYIPVIWKWVLPNTENFLEDNDALDDYSEFEDFNKEDVVTNPNLEKLQNWINDKEWFLIPKEDLRDEFFEELESDKKFLDSLIELWEDEKVDPKMSSFVKELKEQIVLDPKRKIVVFSQYADTIDKLYDVLQQNWLRVISVSWKQKTQTLKSIVRTNFDAWVSEKEKANEYDILLWTDAISEWYNLHRAWTIYNYDIPYNPTRVIQRVWRINRINKKVFEELNIYNYFPSLVWEKIIRGKMISTLKMDMINAILWNDTKTLTEDEELKKFDDVCFVYKDVLDSQNTDQEELSRDTKYRDFLKEEMANDPNLKLKISNIPEKSRLRRSVDKWRHWLLLFAKKGPNILFNFYDKDAWEIIPTTIEDAFGLFEADKNEKAELVSEDFYDNYEILKWNLWWATIISKKWDKKAVDLLSALYEQTWDQFYRKIIKALNLWNLPHYYTRKINKITKANYKTITEELRQEISDKYLNEIISKSDWFDQEREDLIITEEF